MLASYSGRSTPYQLMTIATTVGGVFVAAESGKTKCVDSVQCMNKAGVMNL